MAVLSDTDRADGSAQYMRECWDQKHIFAGVNKADIRAAYNAIDDYMSTNAATINTAIPQPARTNLSTQQKALLMTAVVSKRYLSGV